MKANSPLKVSMLNVALPGRSERATKNEAAVRYTRCRLPTRTDWRPRFLANFTFLSARVPWFPAWACSASSSHAFPISRSAKMWFQGVGSLGKNLAWRMVSLLASILIFEKR